MANNKIATGLSSSLPGNKCITMDELTALVKPLTMSKLVTRIEYCSIHSQLINGGNPKSGAVSFKYTDDNFYEFYPSEYKENIVSPLIWKEYDIKNAKGAVIAQGVYRDFSHYIKINGGSMDTKPTVTWSCGSSSFSSSSDSNFIITQSYPDDNGVYLIKLRLSLLPVVIGAIIPDTNPGWNDNLANPWI